MTFLIPNFSLSATLNSVNFPILSSWFGKRPASTSHAGFLCNPCHCCESTVHSSFVLTTADLCLLHFCQPLHLLKLSPHPRLLHTFSTFYMLETNYIPFLGKRCLWGFYVVVVWCILECLSFCQPLQYKLWCSYCFSGRGKSCIGHMSGFSVPQHPSL